MPDFWDEPDIGIATPLRPRRARVADMACDIWLWTQKHLFNKWKSYRGTVRFKVLIVGVSVPGREDDIRDVTSALSQSRHDVTVSIAPMGNKGKFENIDAAITAAHYPLSEYDWLIITDDDIQFSEGFLDDLIDLSEAAHLTISQPAHRHHSYTSFALTQRAWNSWVRETKFVEIGPLTAIQRRGFSALVPFPPSRWCWGIDLLWSQISTQNHWKMGVIDATPIRHIRPVAATYDGTKAIEEARLLLRKEGVHLTRKDVFDINRRLF